MEDILQLGVFGKAHGIKGEVNLDWHADAPLNSGQIIYLKKNDVFTPFKILTARLHKGRYLVTLDGVKDRGEAELLNGLAVFVSRKCLPPVSPDEFYLQDIIGSSVYMQDGQFLGKLEHVEFPANQQIWSIVNAEGREILFPAQPDFIISIDPVQKNIIIEPPAGLLDIYSA